MFIENLRFQTIKCIFFILLWAGKTSKIKWTINETSTIRVLSLSFHDQSLHTSNTDLNLILINIGFFHGMPRQLP